MSEHVSLKVAPKGILYVQKLWKFRSLGCPSKSKMDECNQKNWSFSAQSGMQLPGLDTYFLEVDASVSLRVATKGHFRDKKLWKFRFESCFSKVKTKECDQGNWRFSNKISIFRQLKFSSPIYPVHLKSATRSQRCSWCFDSTFSNGFVQWFLHFITFVVLWLIAILKIYLCHIFFKKWYLYGALLLGGRGGERVGRLD